MAKKKKNNEIVKIKDESLNNKMIEEAANKSDKKEKEFFSKKKVLLLLLFVILSVTLLALTIKFILNIDFSKLWSSMSLGFTDSLGPVWFLLLIIYFVWSIFSVFTTIWPRLSKLGYKIPQWEYWLFGLTISFLRATTPALFSDPYFIFWLKTKDVPTSRATSILFSNTLFWQIIQFAVTLPSFIMVVINRAPLLSSPEGISSFTFLCAGIMVDTFSISLMVLMNMSKNIHYTLSRIFNWFKKKLHMKYHTKAEIIDKYKNKATMRRDFVEYMKDWKNTTLIFGSLVIAELFTYFAINWSLIFMSNYQTTSGIIKTSFDFGWGFNSANVTFTANRLNFIAPGGEGSLQFFLSTFLIRLGDFYPKDQPDVVKGVVNNAILVWRTFASYLPALVGLCGMIALTSVQINRYKKNKNVAK